MTFRILKSNMTTWQPLLNSERHKLAPVLRKVLWEGKVNIEAAVSWNKPFKQTNFPDVTKTWLKSSSGDMKTNSDGLAKSATTKPKSVSETCRMMATCTWCDEVTYKQGQLLFSSRVHLCQFRLKSADNTSICWWNYNEPYKGQYNNEDLCEHQIQADIYMQSGQWNQSTSGWLSLFRFDVCLKKDSKQCCDASELGCTNRAGQQPPISVAGH